MAGFIDIACNFTHESFKHNLEEVIKNAEREDVEKFVLLCASSVSYTHLTLPTILLV